MKKLLTLGMTLLCGCSLAACGTSPSAQHNANEADGPLTKVASTPKVTLLTPK